MNIDGNTKTIKILNLIYKQKVFRSIFQFAATSSTDVFNLKSAFRTLSKIVHPDNNENNASATLTQRDLLDMFQYLKQEEEMTEIERQRYWERVRLFQE